MDNWEKFMTSGKIADYINYVRESKGERQDDDLKGVDYRRKGQGRKQ
ncbi:MAG: hypothetical protein ACI4I6_05400 [Hominimerdicola sp.]